MMSREEESAWDTNGPTEGAVTGRGGDNRNSISQKSGENRKLQKRKWSTPWNAAERSGKIGIEESLGFSTHNKIYWMEVG